MSLRTHVLTPSVLLLGVLLLAPCLTAQDPPLPVAPVPESLRALPDTPLVRPDTVVTRAGRGDSVRPRPPISPGGAFLRSLLLPGWGQARLNRNFTAGLFVAFEGVAAAMVWKSSWQLSFARTRQKYVESHSQEQQDWIVLLVFNHFFSGAEAFVSAHLWDFPAGLEARTLPSGDLGYGITIPFRLSGPSVGGSVGPSVPGSVGLSPP